MVTQPGEGGGGGRVDLAANPETMVLPAFFSLLAVHVNSLKQIRKLNKDWNNSSVEPRLDRSGLDDSQRDDPGDFVLPAWLHSQTTDSGHPPP